MAAAVAANLPKDNIERAIKRCTQQGDADKLEEIRYEGYACSGVAVLVDCITDNRNRTVAEVRNAFKRGGGSLGSVEHLFQRKGCLKYPPTVDYEHIFELAVDNGAEDVNEYNGIGVEVLTAPGDLERVRKALTEAGCAPLEAKLCMHPATAVQLDADSAPAVLKLLETLDNLEDVQEIHSNAVFPA